MTNGEPTPVEPETLLVAEWPSVLGQLFISSRRKPSPVQPPSEDALNAMDGWAADPSEAIKTFFNSAFRLEWQRGDFGDRAGNADTSVYILVYLCRRIDLAWDLLRIFVPVLRPGLWDDQFRWRLEFMFFEHAWEAVFDYDDLTEPEPGDEFGWARSLNALSDEERRSMLDFAGLPPLPNPRRPEVALWNERWFTFATGAA